LSAYGKERCGIGQLLTPDCEFRQPSESFLSPAQPGLSFEVNLNLQNLDELIGS